MTDRGPADRAGSGGDRWTSDSPSASSRSSRRRCRCPARSSPSAEPARVRPSRSRHPSRAGTASAVSHRLAGRRRARDRRRIGADRRLARLGPHRAPRRHRPAAAPGREAGANVEAARDGRGLVPIVAVARSARRLVHVRAARHPRPRGPAQDTMSRGARARGPVGPGDRARARLPGAVRVSAAAATDLPVLLLDVGSPPGRARARRMVPARRADAAVRRAPRGRRAQRGASADRCCRPTRWRSGCATPTRSTRSRV